MKNELLELLKTRRSVRKYRPEQIRPEELDAVLEAGTYAPTARGAQSPVIVAVQDRETWDFISRLNAQVMGSESDPFYGAPSIVLVLADPSFDTCVEDGSCVLATLMQAAHALGLASCWIHRERQIFESQEGKALLKKWGLPDNLRGVGAIALGYAEGDPPQPKPRKADYIVKI